MLKRRRSTITVPLVITALAKLEAMDQARAVVLERMRAGEPVGSAAQAFGSAYSDFNLSIVVAALGMAVVASEEATLTQQKASRARHRIWRRLRAAS